MGNKGGNDLEMGLSEETRDLGYGIKYCTCSRWEQSYDSRIQRKWSHNEIKKKWGS